MKIKLNGWQRIGVVLNAIYLIIIIIIAWYEWPTQKQIESSWVYSALDAIRKPESPYAYKLRESRFKDISDRELIKRINLYYEMRKPTTEELIQYLEADNLRKLLPFETGNINLNNRPKVQNPEGFIPFTKTQPNSQPQSPGGKLIDIFDRLKPQQPSTIEQTGTPRPPDFESIQSKIEVARNAGYSDSEIADYLAKINNFDIQGARNAGYSNNEILIYFSYKKLNSVTDPFIIAQLEGELITPGEKLAEQCEEKLKEVNLRYQKEIESLGIDRLRIVGISFMAWIIPSGIVYLLCLAIVWIYRGFKENKTLAN